MAVWIAIFLGGGLGAVARYGVGRMAILWLPDNFPYGTLGANVLSAVILGIVIAETERRGMTGIEITFLTIGFCGGFSTFSTFSFETMALLAQGKFWVAALNVAVSIIVCVGILYFLSKRFIS